MRVQWDPERDLHLQPLSYRAIQIGVSGEAVPLFVNQWIRGITDTADLAHTIHRLVKDNKLDQAQAAIRSMNRYSSKCGGGDRGKSGWTGSDVREDPGVPNGATF